MAIIFNELRIGSYIRYVSRLVRVTELRHDNMITTDEFVIAGNEYFEGEPLTPPLLLACGFTQGDFAYDNDKLSIHLPSASYKNGRTYFNSWCIIEGVPFFLHNLQNLIHSLTGKELEYNPVK